MDIALKSDRSRRLYGLDFLKLLCLIAIVIFHVWEDLVYQDSMVMPVSKSLYTYYGIVISTLFHYGGPLLMGLSFFLFGYRDSKFSFPKWCLFLIGILSIQYTSESLKNLASIRSWAWDVYSYLALAYPVAYLSPRNKWIRMGIILVSTFCLLFSSQFYADLFPTAFGSFKPIFVLDRAAQLPNGWFLLPWIFIPPLMFNLGHLVKAYEDRLEKLRSWELPVFVVGFCILRFTTDRVPFLAGPRFNEFVFWQSSAYFWMYFLTFLFCIRLQFAEISHNFFDTKFFHLISKLAWVKHLWFCYLFQFAIIQSFQDFYARHSATPYILDFIMLATLLSTELVGDFLFFLHSRRQKAIQSRRPS
jgi:hypothetical protein